MRGGARLPGGVAPDSEVALSPPPGGVDEVVVGGGGLGGGQPKAALGARPLRRAHLLASMAVLG